jgi:Flp pilus assembly protein TadD
LAEVHNIAGLLKWNSGWHEQAAADYSRAIELAPGNGDAYRRLGMVFNDLKEHDQALAAFRRAVELEPDYHRNHQALGDFWMKRADYAEAIRHFRRTVEVAPDEPVAHFVLAAAYATSGRFPESEAELRVALSLGETPAALNALGMALVYQGRDREAVPYFTQAANRYPQGYLWWMNLGAAYRRLHRSSDAQRANRRALALVEEELRRNPKNGYIRASLAYVCAWLGERDRAQSEIAQAIQLSPGDNDTRRMAAKTYEALGLREDTLAILGASPALVVQDVSRFPDLADLHRDSRFKAMLSTTSK